MEFLPYIISGLVTGSVYGLAGTGLVLTYKTSAVFNFAHGALATVAAFGFYSLYVTHGLPWALAAAICVLVAAPFLGWGFELLARSLGQATLAVRVAATVGILLIIQAAIALIYGTTQTRTLPQFLPQQSFTVSGVPVTAANIIIVVLALVSAVGLFVFFKVSRLGVAMRAVVDNAGLLDIAGTSPQRVRRWAFVIGVAFALASGLLIGPLLASLDPTTITFLVITAFAAAALGGFTSLPLTYAGGLLMGLAQALSTKYFITGFWAGLEPTLPFLVLFVILLVSPRRRLADRSPLIPSGRSAWRTPLPVQAAGGVAVLAVLIAAPAFAGLQLDAWANALAMTVLFLSLGLLVRTSGQVSLCQVSFLAIGVCAMSQFTSVHHLPWLVALVLSGLVAVPVGALLSIPAIRLSGPALALATLGFGLLLQYMFYGQNYMFGTYGLPVSMARPHLSWLAIDSDKGYYYLLLVCACLVAALVVAINRTRLGRLLRGLADSPPGLAATGTSITTSRVLVFCLSAFLAAIAGALQGGIQPVTSLGYQPILSLTYFALVIIAIGGEPWYALFAGFGVTLVPAYLTSVNTANWLSLLFGASAVLYALTPESRRGAPAAVRQVLDRFRWQRRRPAAVRAAAAGAARSPRSDSRQGELSVEALRVQFGGLMAIDDVSLSAPTGRITGLIGPNGAGKTTFLNACSGVLKPSRGRVRIDGANASISGPAKRARRGLGRTFQQMELFDSLTVRQNVTLGAEGRYAGWNLLSHLLATPGQNRQARAAAGEALELCGLLPIADEAVGTLPVGRRRLVELARCLAGSFHLLLLDEPSSGLDRTETRRLGEILRTVVSERGLGILLAEHDISLLTQVCDQVYVVDFGELIFTGTPEEMMASTVVQAAYLGDAEAETAIAEKTEESEVSAQMTPRAQPVPAAKDERQRPGNDPPVLELRNVTAGYGRTTVLHDVSFTVACGNVVALLGPNGAGKTTTLRVALGLMRPQSGTVWAAGADVTRERPHERARRGLCLIPEGRGIFRSLTVRENLRLQVPPWQSDNATDAAVAAFPVLGKRLRQVAGTMSGGEQQMLALARAYLSRPDVVVIDEISLGLAPKVVDSIFASLRRLADDGVALLLVEQYVNRALGMADHVLLLDRGTVSFSGRAGSVDEDTIMRAYLGHEQPKIAGASTADIVSVRTDE